MHYLVQLALAHGWDDEEIARLEWLLALAEKECRNVNRS